MTRVPTLDENVCISFWIDTFLKGMTLWRLPLLCGGDYYHKIVPSRKIIYSRCLYLSKRSILNNFESFLSCKLNYHDQKIQQTPAIDIQYDWTGVSTLLLLFISVYRNLLLEIEPVTTEYWATGLHCP